MSDITATLVEIHQPNGPTVYARTPDGIGFFFYAVGRGEACEGEYRDEQAAEDAARGDVCDVEAVETFDSFADFEEWRALNGYC